MNLRSYGTWTSPITAASAVSQSLGLASVRVDGHDVYWLEVRPQEGGRTALVRLGADGELGDVTPSEMNVRTRVHEYGGGAYCVHARTAYWVNFSDQRVYRQRGIAAPTAITPVESLRYADFIVDDHRRRLVCVREDHRRNGEPTNTLVALPVDANVPHEGDVLASGHDFYSTPRLSPDGRLLSWLAWRHPNMPWDGTELWVASVGDDGSPGAPRCVAGGEEESIFQPGWSAYGDLYFVTDRDGWWHFYRIAADRLASSGPLVPRPLVSLPPRHTEFGKPQWGLGMCTWGLLADGRLVTTFSRTGHAGIAVIDVSADDYRELPLGVEPLDDLAVVGNDLVFVAASETSLPAVVRVGGMETAVQGVLPVRVLRTSSTFDIEAAYLTRPEPIEFPTSDGQTAHGLYYAPRNPGFAAPPGERPPLIVIIHGGPTDAAKPTLRLATQFWTTRGFALVDVDHRGSTGYGRAYRNQLNGKWGVVDVADCVDAARYLVRNGKADPDRLVIRGGSAGGYTTLAAVTFHPHVFKAAASYYGICDLEALAGDTHKFESRYTDKLIGPYPAQRDVYRARSPIHFVDQLATPLILFHGADDKVVPLNQAEKMASALREKGLPVALVVFDGEQHGFRKAASVTHALEAELQFYGSVFGLDGVR